VWRVDPERMATDWRAATPFPHIVIDDVLDPADLDTLMAVLDEGPVEGAVGDLFAFEATAPEPTTPGLRELRDRFASELAPVLARIGGRPVARVDMRAYAYRPGHYLLPHTDHQDGLGRIYAYAFYLPSPEPPIDGALELFSCRLDDGAQLIAIASAKQILPRANRLVVFEVGARSLHQVREVLGGLRISLAGWFYA
jgi:hypothetical protein